MLTRYDLLTSGARPARIKCHCPRYRSPVLFQRRSGVLVCGRRVSQATTHWTHNFRSVLGFRVDYQHGTDIDYLAALHETAGYTNGGTAQQALGAAQGQPRSTRATDYLEFYLSAGRGFHSADLRGVNQDVSVDLGLPHTPLLAKQEGQEVGVRAAVGAISPLRLPSITCGNSPRPSSIRTSGPIPRALRAAVTAMKSTSPTRSIASLEFYGSYSGDHTRFTLPSTTAPDTWATYITDAPVATGSLGAVPNESRSLERRFQLSLSRQLSALLRTLRRFGCRARLRAEYTCANAPTALGQVNGKGFGEWNLDARYAFSAGWSASLGIYNLLNTHAAAAEFWYVDRLQGEPPIGVADVHEHPLEPIMARFTVTKKF